MLGNGTAVGVTQRSHNLVSQNLRVWYLTAPGATHSPPKEEYSPSSSSARARNPCWDHELPQEGPCCGRSRVIHWVNLQFPLFGTVLSGHAVPSASQDFCKTKFFNEWPNAVFLLMPKTHVSP